VTPLRFPGGVLLRPPAADHELGRWAPVDGGDLVAAWLPTDDEGRGRMQVAVHESATGEVTKAYALDGVALQDPRPALLPDDRVLLAGRPVPVRSKDPKVRARSLQGAPAARVFDASGAVVAEGSVGDGITHLFSTSSGRVWVSYNDQEIFGDPTMKPGIARFDADLQLDFSYAGNRYDGFIGDCYALALTGEIAWACYYEHWPLVRLDPPQVNTFMRGAPGVSALAVDGTLLALVGGYGEDADRLVLGSFDLADGFDPWYSRRLCAPDGGPLPDGVRPLGRDDTIHAVLDGEWLRVRLADLAL
jgi:hypothetical protein